MRLGIPQNVRPRHENEHLSMRKCVDCGRENDNGLHLCFELGAELPPPSLPPLAITMTRPSEPVTASSHSHEELLPARCTARGSLKTGARVSVRRGSFTPECSSSLSLGIRSPEVLVSYVQPRHPTHPATRIGFIGQWLSPNNRTSIQCFQ
jgi:hypothetical protein